MKSSLDASLPKGLLEAARHDRPTPAQRSRIWEQVALAPHLVVVAPIAAEVARSSVAPAGKALGVGLAAGKLLIAGAIAGSAVTVGLGMFLMRAPLATPRAPAAAMEVRTTDVKEAPARVAPASQAEVGSVEVAPSPLPVVGPVAPAVESPTHAAAEHPRTRKAVAAAVASDDMLMREAALVGKARTAIVEGRGGDAIEALDAAARDPAHSLEPEELSLRVRALRLLGRDAEAARVGETLRTRYPESALLGK